MRYGICVKSVRNGGNKRVTEKCVTTADELTAIKTKVLNVVVIYCCCFMSQYLYFI